MVGSSLPRTVRNRIYFIVMVIGALLVFWGATAKSVPADSTSKLSFSLSNVYPRIRPLDIVYQAGQTRAYFTIGASYLLSPRQSIVADYKLGYRSLPSIEVSYTFNLRK